jgi:hypothetical protein
MIESVQLTVCRSMRNPKVRKQAPLTLKKFL